MARRLNMAQRDEGDNAAGDAEHQRQPQGAQLADVRDGKARDIAAEHANTN